MRLLMWSFQSWRAIGTEMVKLALADNERAGTCPALVVIPRLKAGNSLQPNVRSKHVPVHERPVSSVF